MKWIKRSAYIVLTFFIVLNAMAIFHAWQFTHFYPDAKTIDLKTLGIGQKLKILFFGYEFPKSVVKEIPSLPYDKVTMVTESNELKISGWLFRNDSTPHAVILFHGHGNTKADLNGQAKYFFKLGYSVLAIDFRAHGESDGTTCTGGYVESEEVKLAFDLMKLEGYESITLYGVSMGAAAIVKALRDYQLPVHKIILDMSFGSVLEALQGRMRIVGLPPTPLAQMLTFWGGVEHGYWAFNFSPCDYAAIITCPVLVQWGDQDPRVTESETNCIYESLGKNEPAGTAKKLVVYEGAGHQNLQKFDPEKWEAEVGAFLRE